MAGPIDPMGRADRPHPLLYVLLVIVLANLAITFLVYQRSLTSTQPGSVQASLPQYLTRSALSELAERIEKDFNSRDWTSFYEQFDPVAQVQFTQEEVETKFERLAPLIGKIERAEYSHYKALGQQDAGGVFELNYVLEVSGGTFSSGIMKVTFVDRGDHPGIFSVFINGKS